MARKVFLIFLNAKLMFVIDSIFVKKFNQALVNNFFKNCTENRQNGNRLIVVKF